MISLYGSQVTMPRAASQVSISANGMKGREKTVTSLEQAALLPVTLVKIRRRILAAVHTVFLSVSQS